MNATLRLARAEVRKLFTTRTVPVTVAIAAVVAVGSVLIDAAVAGRPGQHPLGSIMESYQMLKFGPVVVMAMLILGILAAGGEFRHRTIVPALLTTPRRPQVFAVKVAVIALFGAVFAAVVFGLGLGTVAGVTQSRGHEASGGSRGSPPGVSRAAQPGCHLFAIQVTTQPPSRMVRHAFRRCVAHVPD